MADFLKRLSNLLSVKSLVTLILTFVFAFLAVTGGIDETQIMTVYTVVIAFYFGTQATKDWAVPGSETIPESTAVEVPQRPPDDGDLNEP